jgi:tetratricopeptide (TPR) repeat protein
LKNLKELYREGKFQLKKGNYKNAINVLFPILEKNPNLPRVWNQLGICFSKINAHERAIECFENGLKYDPKNKSLYHNLGIVYYQKQDYQKVFEVFKELVKIYPKNHLFWNNIGVACMFLGKVQDSIDAYKKALEINPQYDTAWKNLCKNYSKMGVEFNYEDLKPNQELSWYFLAKTLLNSEFYEESLDALNQCLTLNPGFHAAYKIRKEISKSKKLFSINKVIDNDISKREVSPKEIKTIEVQNKKDKRDPLFHRFKETQQKIKAHLRGLDKKDKIKVHSPAYQKLSLEEKFKILQTRFHERKKLDLVDTETEIEISSDMLKEDKTKSPRSRLKKTEEKSPRVVSSNGKININGKIYNPNEIWVVVDGANVALTRQTSHYQGKLSNLKILRNKLMNLGFIKFKILCDRSLYHRIDEPLVYKKMVQKEEFIETPAGTEADFFILNFAKEKQAFVISNDRFMDHYDEFGGKWIKKIRIAFTFIEDSIYFDKIYNQ